MIRHHEYVPVSGRKNIASLLSHQLFAGAGSTKSLTLACRVNTPSLKRIRRNVLDT